MFDDHWTEDCQYDVVSNDCSKMCDEPACDILILKPSVAHSNNLTDSQNGCFASRELMKAEYSHLSIIAYTFNVEVKGKVFFSLTSDQLCLSAC